MNIEGMSDDDKMKWAERMFVPLQSSEQIKNWVKTYLELEIPLEITDPDSTSSPLDAVWQIYNTFKHNTGDVNPGYILMSCREGMKCQEKGSKILGIDGIKSIEDIKRDDVIWTGFSWQRVTETFDEGLKEAITVRVDGGHTVTGTPVHRYWCLRDGVEQWIASKDLNPENDLICLNVNTGHAKFTPIKSVDRYETGYFLGLLIGDGGLTRMDKNKRVTLTTQDGYIKSFFYSFCEKHFVEYNIYQYGIDYSLTGKSVLNQLKDWGLSDTYSWEKEVPNFVWSDIDVMKGFIAGVFDTDGCWDKKGDCFFEMTAGKLLDQIQIILTALGVESRVRHCKKLHGMQKHLTSKLSIGRTESRKLERLGIIFRAKKAQKYIPTQNPNCNDALPISSVRALLDVCDNVKGLIRNRTHIKPSIRCSDYDSVTVDKLSKLCLWMRENEVNGLTSEEDMSMVRRYEEILKNKWKTFTVEHNDEKRYFYDLTVENEHSYWSNGTISHNTVSVAILETLLLLHFQLDIGHAAATEDQSAVALGYIEGFLLKIDPLIKLMGWTNLTKNKRKFEFLTPARKKPYIKIVICTLKGMNSLHSNVLFLDELDLADPKALKEGANITGYSKGIHGVTVYLSTRKYAFGNMAAAIEKARDTKYKVINWNIIDVTERCPVSRHQPDGPKKDVYVAKNLPLQKITREQFDLLPIGEKMKWDLLEKVHAGCVECPLLPVCRTRLAAKSPTACGGFYKPISTVIQAFAKNDADTAEAQLMCWRPGSTGLVYPRFSIDPKKGNVISVKEAYETLIGPTTSPVNELTLLNAMKIAGILFYAGVDWGYTHDYVITVVALIPNGDVWLMETYAAPGLEFDDQLLAAKSFRDKYGMHKWFADTAMPSSIKTFNKSGMKCPTFKKDVMGGIEAMRSKIMAADGTRRFKVLDVESNKKALSALSKHRFKLDGQGNTTLEPDDTTGVADICDTLRYIGQNMYPVLGHQKPQHVWLDPQGKPLDMSDPESRRKAEFASIHENQMLNKIAELVGPGEAVVSTKKKGGFFFVS